MMGQAASFPVALVIAGSDSGGGAGIQADIKTFDAHRVFSATAITALTAQNTKGVKNIHSVPAEFVAQQIEAVISDLPVAVVKTGMLANAEVVKAVAQSLAKGKGIPLVLDPVMVAKGGGRLLASDAVDILKKKLLPLAHIVTPNLPEAEVLTGQKISSLSDMKAAATQIQEMGASAVLLKGGHGEGDELIDLLLYEDSFIEFPTRRIESRHTHGTGCTMASAIAANIAHGHSMPDAVQLAQDFVRRAIESAPGLGAGHGPLNHFVPPRLL